MSKSDCNFIIQSNNSNIITSLTKYLAKYPNVTVYDKKKIIQKENVLYFIDIVTLIDGSFLLPPQTDYFLIGSYSNLELQGKQYMNNHFQDFLLVPVQQDIFLHKITMFFEKKKILNPPISKECWWLLIRNLIEKITIHKNFLQEYCNLLLNKTVLEKMQLTYPHKLANMEKNNTKHFLSLDILQKLLELLSYHNFQNLPLQEYHNFLEASLIKINKILSFAVKSDISELNVYSTLRLLLLIYFFINIHTLNTNSHYEIKYKSTSVQNDLLEINKGLMHYIKNSQWDLINFLSTEEQNNISITKNQNNIQENKTYFLILQDDFIKI